MLKALPLKIMLPLLCAVAAFSCNRNAGKKAPTPLHEAIWVARKCTNAQNEEILCPYIFLRLFKNGKFSGGALRGYVDGDWELDSTNKLVILKPGPLAAADEKSLTFLGIVYHSANYLQLGLIRNEEDLETGNIPLVSLKAVRVTADADPFNPKINTWRHPPSQFETPEELKARVKNYLVFLQKFYGFLVANKIEEVDTDWFPNVINMAGHSSVRLAYSTELKEWNKCFYNEEQAVEAYKILSGPFFNLKLKADVGIYERNADVVNQMLSMIEPQK